MSEEILISTDFNELKLYKRGKVRDVYVLDDNLLIVSTDRISCFDVVLDCGIPYKGKVLTGLCRFWFDFIKDIIPHHFITSDITQYPPQLQKYREIISGRSMLVKKTKPFAVECVVRGYLSGSAWKEYQQNQSVCDIRLPPGLKESERLPQPLFTPSTKADTAHDVNINQQEFENIVGQEAAEIIKRISLKVYEEASNYALRQGIIIADTKFEFGLLDGNIILIDELLTPDSSRFWPKDEYQPGKPQPSFDKQFVRDYLESLGWDKNPPAPPLPKEIITRTSQKYLEAYRRITGKELL